MSQSPHLRIVFWIIIGGWAGGSMGCTHNYYYGTGATIPGCPPGTQPVTTRVGSVCDVPEGNVVVSGSSASKTISSNVSPQPGNSAATMSSAAADRVVISQPAYGPPSIGQTSNRIKSPWRKPDPDVPIIKAEGAYDDSVIK